MSRETLERDIASGALLVLDSSVVLAYLGGGEPTSPAAINVVDGLVRPGRNRAVVSAVTVTETLVRPFRAGSSALVSAVDDFLLHFPNLSVLPADYEVAREAARVRGLTRLRTPDALVIATAVVSGAAMVVGNDERWRSAVETLGRPFGLSLLGDHLD